MLLVSHALACSFGFVNFKNLSDAVRAKREMEGKPLATSTKLSIQFTKVLHMQTCILVPPCSCLWHALPLPSPPCFRRMRVVVATMVDLSAA